MKQKKENKEYILFTSNNFPTGGPGATYINLFCKGVVENGGQIKVYLFKGHIYKELINNNGRRGKTSYGVEYNYLGFANRPNNKIIKLLEDFLSVFRTNGLMLSLFFKRKKVTLLVYSNGLPYNLPLYLFSKLFQIKIISFVPEFLENNDLKKNKLFEKIMFFSFFLNFHFLNKLSDKLIVFSTYLKTHYINNGFSNSDIFVQPNLTDLNSWYIQNTEIQYTIGYAGTPSKKDGLIDLIHAVKILKEEGCVINVLIIGDSINTGSLIPFYKKKCEEFGIINHVYFTGLVPPNQVKFYLNKCQILAVTRPNTQQTKAGFPTKIGEYMACKKVVLATNFGDVEQYFTDKIDIVLAESDNPVSIAENISWILNNSSKSEKIAKKGFEKAEEVLDYKKATKKIMRFL